MAGTHDAGRERQRPSRVGDGFLSGGKSNTSASASTREFRNSGGFIRIVIQPGATKADGSELLCRALDDALIRLSPVNALPPAP